MKPITPIYLVDAFAKEPGSGNPAGVCFINQERPREWMQKIAREMNQAETAFLLQKDNGYHLRWFTPETEVELCGHATLASAHVIWESELAVPEETIQFETLSGILTARQSGNLIELNFPIEPAFEIPVPDEIISALGVQPVFCGRNRFDFLLVLESEEQVLRLKPDFAALQKISGRGFIVTATSSQKEYDFVSRFFAPGVGINEDPVTGSAHCCLGPYWKEQLGKSTLKGFQASSRGGEVEVEISGQRALLRGNAVTVMQGVLRNV